MRRVHCTVGPRGVSGTPVLEMDPQERSVAVANRGGHYAGILDLDESPDGHRLVFAVCDTDHPGWGSWIRWAGGAVRYEPTPIEPGDYEGPLLESAIATADWVHVDGLDFRDSMNQRWIWRGASDFSLYARFLANEPIQPILEERYAVGARVLRVFLMWHWFKSGPALLSLDRLADFVRLCASHGLLTELVAFCDAQVLLPYGAGQRARLASVVTALAGEFAFVELANEFPQNGIRPEEFEKPPLIASRGSGLGDGMPAFPAWDYVTFHPRRDFPKLLRSEEAELTYGWPGFAGFHCPVVNDEPIGAADVDVPGRRSTNPDWFYKMARMSSAWNGATFHSDNGLWSDPFSPAQRRCAQAFFEGLGG